MDERQRRRRSEDLRRDQADRRRAAPGRPGSRRAWPPGGARRSRARRPIGPDSGNPRRDGSGARPPPWTPTRAGRSRPRGALAATGSTRSVSSSAISSRTRNGLPALARAQAAQKSASACAPSAERTKVATASGLSDARLDQHRAWIRARARPTVPGLSTARRRVRSRPPARPARAPRAHVVEKPQRRRVGPVAVVDQQRKRTGAREVRGQPVKAVDDRESSIGRRRRPALGAAGRRRDVLPAAPPAVLARGADGRPGCAGGRAELEQRSRQRGRTVEEGLTLLRRRLASAAPRTTAARLRTRTPARGRCHGPAAPESGLAQPCRGGLQKRCLTDSRWSADNHDTACAVAGVRIASCIRCSSGSRSSSVSVRRAFTNPFLPRVSITRHPRPRQVYRARRRRTSVWNRSHRSSGEPVVRGRTNAEYGYPSESRPCGRSKLSAGRTATSPLGLIIG